MRHLIILDVETGGLDHFINPICQVSFSIVDENFEQKAAYSAFIQPYRIFGKDPVYEPKALQYNKITMKQLYDGLVTKDVVKVMIELFDRYKGKKKSDKPMFVGHNFSFDKGFVETLFRTQNQDIWKYVNANCFDTMTMSWLKWPDLPSYTLTNCCDKVGINLVDAHDAENDVAATTQLFKELTLSLRGGKAHDKNELVDHLNQEVELSSFRKHFKV